jgi:uncharacterized membrane protein YtjA (UPF0391 family)
MTMILCTFVLLVMSLATGIFAFGGFHEPAPGVAVVLFMSFTALLAFSVFADVKEYRTHHHL